MTNRQFQNRAIKSCVCVLRENESPVQPNLSVSAETMYDMNRKGIAISTQNLPESTFEKPNSDNSFYRSPEHRRGVDVCDLWEAEQTAKKKMSKARRKDIESYGQYQPNNKE